MDRVLLVMKFNPGGLGLIDYLHHISELERIAEFYALKSFTSFSTFLSVHFFSTIQQQYAILIKMVVRNPELYVI